MNTRNHGFDSLKGVLIVLVVAGHVMLGTLEENRLREFIYFFHMPVFLAVSGYFTNLSAFEGGFASILLKYKNRLLIPFAIAFSFYTSIQLFLAFENDTFSVSFILSTFLYPYYHLWYVPAVVIFAFYLKAIESFPKVMAYIALFGFFVLTVWFEGHGKNLSDSIVLKALGDKRFYFNFSYYYIGYILAGSRWPYSLWPLLSGIFVGVGLYLFADSTFLIGFGTVVANFCFILVLFERIKRNDYQSGVFAQLGRVSLPLYLWHVFPIMVLKSLELNDVYYYTASTLLLTSMAFGLFYFNGKFYFLDRFLYGLARG